MRKNQKHIIVFLSLVLFTGILTPSILHFTHFTVGHSHVSCDEHSQTHFHQYDFHCKLYDFHHAPQILYTPPVYTFVILEPAKKQIFSDYFFLSNQQKLYFSLRAPPMV